MAVLPIAWTANSLPVRKRERERERERESATYSFDFFRFFDSCRGAGTFTFVWLMTFVLRRRTALQLVLERIVTLDADALQQVPHLVFLCLCLFVLIGWCRWRRLWRSILC
jgi:hypothetical protein